ncbi:hypothetical protein ACFSKM_14270 [Ancylobacter dichloromethanicus]
MRSFSKNFGKFQHDQAGLDILEENLATEEQIYASSSYADKQLAAINSQLQGNVIYYNIWNMARPDLSVLFNDGSLLSPGNNFSHRLRLSDHYRAGTRPDGRGSREDEELLRR